MSKPNLKKSFEWLFDRFTKENIKTCQFDLDCLVSIAEKTNEINKEAFQENTIFAKMYVYCLMHELEYYKDIEFSTKKLNEVLDAPLEKTCDDFLKRLNHLELNKYLKSIGINTDHLKQLTKEEEAKQGVLMNENKKTIQIYVLGKFTKENVFKSINNAITNCIINFKNKN
jgi:hypothetical protein